MDLAPYLEELRVYGHTVIPNVLPRQEVDALRARIWALAEATEANGVPTRVGVDPNDRSIRLANLINKDPAFRDLILHPTALDVVSAVVGEDFLISNFSANIALPGARSMKVHSDLAIVLPEPWLAPLSLNIGWCLNDVSEHNGSTRVLSGSHLYQTRADLPDDIEEKMVSLTAPKGAITVMDGRLWHTSGNNRSDGERAMLFGYYTVDFLRPQQNWAVTISAEKRRTFSPELLVRLGITPKGTKLGDYLNFTEEERAEVAAADTPKGQRRDRKDRDGP